MEEADATDNIFKKIAIDIKIIKAEKF